MNPLSQAGRANRDRERGRLAAGEDDGELSEKPGLLSRIGSSGARHPRRRVGLWLIGLVAVLLVATSAGGTFSDKVELPGTQAHTGLQLLEKHDRAAAGFSGQIVFHNPSASLTSSSSEIEQVVTELRKLPHVQSASDPLASGSGQLSPDGKIAYSTVHFDERTKLLGQDYIKELEAATAPARKAGITVEYGGGLDELFRPSPNDALSEVIGITVALLVLLIGFGSVLGALIPLGSALIAVATALGLLITAASLTTFGTTAPTLALMIGLGVGIDYCLFVSTRYRQLVADGDDPVDAAGTTVATSGHAVLVAAERFRSPCSACTSRVSRSSGSLDSRPSSGSRSQPSRPSACCPGALGLAGRKIDRWHVRTPVAEAGDEADGWHRYAHTIARRPWVFLTASVIVLLVLAIPLLSINLGHIDDGADPGSFTDKQAYDLIAQGFGTGANGPFTIVVNTQGSSASQSSIAQKVNSALSKEKGVAKAGALKATSDGALLIGTVVPSTSPQAEATDALFRRLKSTTLPEALQNTGAKAYVTGNLATQIQFRDTLTSRLPIVIGVVVMLAFLLLLCTFRSLLIAIKAAI